MAMSSGNPDDDSGVDTVNAKEAGSGGHEAGAPTPGAEAGGDATPWEASVPADLDASTGAGNDSSETKDTGTTTESIDAGSHPDGNPSDAHAGDVSVSPVVDAGQRDTGSGSPGEDAQTVDTGTMSEEPDASVHDSGSSSGEGDAAAEGDAAVAVDAETAEDAGADVSTETPDSTVPVTYAADAKPIFQMKCAPCHTTGGSDGVNFATNYSDTQKAANLGTCSGLTVGACTIVEIQSGFMPYGAGCTGNPATDQGNGACLTAAQQATIRAWIDDGQQP